MPQTRVIQAVSRSNPVDMPAPLSPKKTQLIKAILAIETPHAVIASKVSCAERTVRKIEYNLAHYDSVSRPKAAQQGRKPNMTEEMELVRCYRVSLEFAKSRDF